MADGNSSKGRARPETRIDVLDVPPSSDSKDRATSRTIGAQIPPPQRARILRVPPRRDACPLSAPAGRRSRATSCRGRHSTTIPSGRKWRRPHRAHAYRGDSFSRRGRRPEGSNETMPARATLSPECPNAASIPLSGVRRPDPHSSLRERPNGLRGARPTLRASDGSRRCRGDEEHTQDAPASTQVNATVDHMRLTGHANAPVPGSPALLVKAAREVASSPPGPGRPSVRSSLPTTNHYLCPQPRRASQSGTNGGFQTAASTLATLNLQG